MFNRIEFAISGVGLSIALNFGAIAQQPPMLSDADYMKQALAAGPEAVAKGAAVMRPEHDGTMRTLRQGTNGPAGQAISSSPASERQEPAEQGRVLKLHPDELVRLASPA